MEISKKIINMKDTLECGQIFRFRKTVNGYEIHSRDQYCKIDETVDKYILSTTSDDYFYNFFDLGTDYDEVLNKLRSNKLLKGCIPNTPTIRILKQDPYEMIFSFIVSANNNIPRIKGIIERMCEGCGINGAFPTADALAAKNLDYFMSIGLGYRAQYILNTANKIVYDEFDVSRPYNMETENARKYLMTLMGVGPKVADCILLFGYSKFDVFPVDTWVKKIYKDLFNEEASVDVMRKNLIEEFGNYSGIAQQYLFNQKRNY